MCTGLVHDVILSKLLAHDRTCRSLSWRALLKAGMGHDKANMSVTRQATGAGLEVVSTLV